MIFHPDALKVVSSLYMARSENIAIASLSTSKPPLLFFLKLFALAAVTVMILSLKALSPVKTSKLFSINAVKCPLLPAANISNLLLLTAFSISILPTSL